MSRNFRIFAFAAVVLVIVGAMNDSRVMFVLAGVCAAVMLIAYLLSQLALSRLRLETQSTPGTATAGGSIGMHVRVRSAGSITIGSTVVEVTAENLTVPGVEARRRALLPAVPPGGELTVDMTLTPPLRGRYRLGPPVLIDSDPIGMFEHRRAFGEADELVVFPRTYDLPRVAAWDTGRGRRSSRSPQARRDRGEFRGIREHIPGDDLRHVHWKVSAHLGELAVREYEPVSHDLISIHLDLGAENHYGEGALSTLETAVSASASIARAGLAEQRNVAVRGRGLPREIARPGSGQAHLHRIMVALAEAWAAAGGDYASELSRELRAVPRGASVFVITTAAEEGLARALTAGAASAESITMLVVESELEGAPERFATQPRRSLQAAQAAGAHVARLRSAAELTEALAVAGSVRARRASAEVV